MDRNDTNHEKNSVAGFIEHLARTTEAPEKFVRGVRDLFEKKGLDLDADVGPYREAIEAAFLREGEVRSNLERARAGLQEIQKNVTEMTKHLRTHYRNLEGAAAELRASAEMMRSAGQGTPARSETKNGFVLPPGGWIVPGPEDEQ